MNTTFDTNSVFNKYKRMFKRGARHGVLDECLTMAAILEVGGIIIPGSACPQAEAAWYSEPLAHMLAYRSAESSGELTDIDALRFSQAQTLKGLLKDEAGKRGYALSSGGELRAVVDAVVAVMQANMWVLRDNYSNWYNVRTNEVRTLAPGHRLHHYVTGNSRDGAEPYHFIVGLPSADGKCISMPSFVSRRHFVEVLSDTARVQSGLSPGYSLSMGMVECHYEVRIGKTVDHQHALDRLHPQAPALFASALADSTIWWLRFGNPDAESVSDEVARMEPKAAPKSRVQPRDLDVHDLLPNQQRHAQQDRLRQLLVRNASTLRRIHNPPVGSGPHFDLNGLFYESLNDKLERFYAKQLAGAYSIDDVPDLSVLVWPEPQMAMAA